MPDLIFKYSSIYDATLADLTGNQLNVDYEEGVGYAQRFEHHWSAFRQTIFSYFAELGLRFPPYWPVYLVSSQKGLRPFSDPLTLVMKEDFSEVTATLVHELGHAVLSYYENETIWNDLFEPIKQKYEGEDFTTQMHLIVNLLAAYGLKRIYSPAEVTALLGLEKQYSGLKEAWAIIDAIPGILEQSGAVEAIKMLLNNPRKGLGV